MLLWNYNKMNFWNNFAKQFHPTFELRLSLFGFLRYLVLLRRGILSQLLEFFLLLFLAFLFQFLLTLFVLIVYFSQSGILSA